MANILVIDDNETLREGAAAVLSRLEHNVQLASSGEEGVKLVTSESIDLVITDLKMDGLDGIGVLKAVKEYDSEIAVVLMTAFGTIENAVHAIKHGAFDYIQKPFSNDVLRHKTNQALEWRTLRRQAARLEATAEVLGGARDHQPSDGTFMGIVGQSPAMLKIYETIEKVAANNAAVAIHGESGTGKELVAAAIHKLSPRTKGPFIKVNCGAIPDNLIESELFGHEKGAFTGAVKQKLGRFELADGGTILLDEIGELPLNMQVKLLRVLQERVVDRVGGEHPIPIDVRIISATNRDLQSEVESGRFREDLFYRLHVIPISIPALRERTDDIIVLARYFLETLAPRTNPRIKKLTTEAESALNGYHYPGNIRELMNIIEQALVFAEAPNIDVHDLPSQVSQARPSVEQQTIGLRRGPLGLTEFLESVERKEILEAYENAGGVKTETARLLGIKTSALYYKLEKYGIGTVAGRRAQNTESSQS